MKNRSLIASLALTTIVGSMAFGAGSAHAVSTAQEFINACQTNVGNVVTLTQSIQFQSPTSSTANYNVGTKCKVVLAEGATLQLDLVRFSFAGAFEVQGGRVQLDKSHITAPSIRLGLANFEGELGLNESSIKAIAGNMAVTFGEKGKLSMLKSGGWTGGGLDATGTLTVTSGPLFSGTVVESGLKGTQGLTLNVNGAESSWLVEKSTVHAGEALGVWMPFRLNASASKASIVWADVQVRGASSFTAALSGAESNVEMKNVYRAGFAGTVSIRAMGAKSTVALENSVFHGSPSVVVETGAEGVTKATGPFAQLRANAVTGSSVRVAAGAGGSCFSDASTSVGTAGTISVCA